uniref:Uncharacterized protein n=1 Tax=Tanacetum cinerariifolium TaxID=118510 RepID=A0A6L2P0Q3_TANCI|nr:hypothetical protein [Tanacetum cinerariifolium]
METQKKVLDLEDELKRTKTAQQSKIDDLERRVKKLEKKHMLKTKSFAKIQELFDNAMKRINTLVDFRTELVEESTKKDKAKTTQESSSNREGDELEQERSKKQKVEDDKESKELKKCLEIVPDDGDDVTIDATPLSSKSKTIVDYKIYKEGKKNYFQIFRADGNSQMYLTFSKLLKNIDREDLEKKLKSRRTKRKDTEVPQLTVPTSVTDKAVNEEMDASLERAATTATNLDTEHNIIKTQSKATPNESVS